MNKAQKVDEIIGPEKSKNEINDKKFGNRVRGCSCIEGIKTFFGQEMPKSGTDFIVNLNEIEQNQAPLFWEIY